MKRSELFVLPSSISKLFLPNGTENPNVDNIDYYPRYIPPTQSNLYIINGNTSTIGEDSFGNLVDGWDTDSRNTNLVDSIINSYPRHMLQNLVVIAGKDGTLIPVAGSYFTKMMDHEPGIIEPNSCLITNEDGEILGFLKITNIDVTENYYSNGTLLNNLYLRKNPNTNQYEVTDADLYFAPTRKIIFEGGTTNDAHEIAIDVETPSQDRNITIPNASGTIALQETSPNPYVNQLTSTISVIRGGTVQNNSRIYYTPPDLVTAGGTINPVVNRIYYIPIYIQNKSLIIRKLRCLVGSTGVGNVILGIYDSNSNGRPGSLLYKSSSLALSNNAYIEASPNILPSIQGYYWMASVFSNSSAILRCYLLTSGYTRQGIRDHIGFERWIVGEIQDNATFDLPATATPIAADTMNIPQMELSYTS